MDNTVEILASLGSLYPLQPFEEDAVNTVVGRLTAKPTVLKEDGFGDRAELYNYCPSCDRDLGYFNLEEVRFCPYCGQRVEEVE